MPKYHISEAGNPAKCEADVRACPRGGEERHYESKDEARLAYEAENDKNTFASYTNISFDDRKQNLKTAFSESFPDVQMMNVVDTQKFADKYKYDISLRKNEEIVFRTVAKTEFASFTNQDAEKFAKDNGLKYHRIRNTTTPIFNPGDDPHHHAVFTAIRPKSKDEKIREREEKIRKAQEELEKLRNEA